MGSTYELGAKNEEIWSDGFLRYLAALNGLIVQTGSTIEGNLFYFHRTDQFEGLPPDPKRAHKRKNFCRAVRHKTTLLEVGFNAGHSALLALSSNPNLQYLGVDIAINPYVEACGRFMEKAFPGRFKLIIADSREALPRLAADRAKFDVIHVDGGHSVEICRADISNSLRLATPNAHLILDDTRTMRITEVYNEFVAKGYLLTENLCHMWEGRENVFAKIIATD
jgi:hypothetical protein